MIVCVYAICKNESKFVDRWMDSMREADSVYVLDTGSADDTAALLRARGAQVTVETTSTIFLMPTLPSARGNACSELMRPSRP